MNEPTSQSRCSHCDTALADDHTGPCPQCGKMGKTISVGLAEEVDIAGRVLGITIACRRDWGGQTHVIPALEVRRFLGEQSEPTIHEAVQP